MKKIRVLEMIDRPFLGGGQAALLALAANLDKERFDVQIGAKDGGPLEEKARSLGLRFLPVPLEKKISLSATRAIRRLLEENAIDILHTHGGIAGLFGRRAAHKSRTPVVVHTLHGIHYLHYRNRALRFLSILLERLLSARTDAVIFVSEADFGQGRCHRLAPEAKMALIKNGIDVSGFQETEAFDKTRKELKWKLKLNTPVVGTVARLHRQKGLIYLLRAAPLIQRGAPEAKIIIIGGGPLERELREEAQRLGLDRFLVMLGERRDARELLSLVDVFVLPSLWEGLPLALLEAAAMGKPIVATDVDGVREVIKDEETGLLVPPGNPEKLAETVLRLLQNKDLAQKLGENARATIPPAFTLSKMVDATEQLYLRLYRASRPEIF